MKIALLIAYDGTGFRGFAKQRAAKVRTVQGVLEERLSVLLKAKILTTGAGRTDSGVHAWGQVVSFDAPEGTDPGWLQRRLNRWVAPEITVRAAAAVLDSFDARHSARRRVYEYAIYQSEVPNPFLEPFAWHVTVRLDLKAMRAASRLLLGEHDFASFCRSGEGTSRRRLRSMAFVAREERLVIRVAADSFCQQMVRSLVGTLVQVGEGVRAPDDVARVLEARDRADAGPVAPAKGLTLVSVGYSRDPF
jgi:tRNA pseudouridine38-40 synthase